MPANSRWDLIQRLKVKIVKNPGNGRLNNLNDPVLNVLIGSQPSNNSLHSTNPVSSYLYSQDPAMLDPL